MTRTEMITAFEMRVDNYTYQEIADSLGYSRQHIHQALKNTLGTADIKISSKTIYPNLEKAIKSKHKTVSAFLPNTPFKSARIRDILYGKVKVSLEEAVWLSEYFDREITYLFKKKEVKG